jgi:F-type H+-transporting ATPase subunit a
MTISPDNIIYWQWEFITLNATIVYTWVVMALMTIGAWLVTRKLSPDLALDARDGKPISSGQNLLEVVVLAIRDQIQQIGQQDPQRYIAFIGTLFLFIAVSNLLGVVPGFHPPTGSLSTTAALAICVFIAVPIFGISGQGLGGYLKQYIQPSPLMLPFNIVGEISRTLALAVRLFGNVMSGTMIVAILLSIVPLLFPIVMQLLGLLTGMIQAYIFAVLAMVYIASATRGHVKKAQDDSQRGEEQDG